MHVFGTNDRLGSSYKFIPGFACSPIITAMKALTSLVFLLAALAGAAQMMNHSSMDSTSAAPNERLGTVSFPVSCATPSQAPFNRGVALLHDFWYEESRASSIGLPRATQAAQWRTGASR